VSPHREQNKGQVHAITKCDRATRQDAGDDAVDPLWDGVADDSRACAAHVAAKIDR
jgi:hypothetical protein